MITQKDKERLREVAKLNAELAASERNKQLWKEWMAYGSSKQPERPMIRIEIETFEQDILPEMIKCEGQEAREIEKRMMRPIANFTLFEDDTMVPPYYPVFGHGSFVPFNLPVKKKETNGIGHHFIPYLTDLEEDDHLLQPSVFQVDEAAAEAEMLQMQNILGDILPVKRISNCLGCCLTQDIVHIMNMDDMYIAMVDDEERFHAMMRRLTDDYLAFFRMIEEKGILHSAARMQHLNQGTYCFTDELKDDIDGAKLKDTWLFMDSQETAGISPTMYQEMIFPYYKEVMDQFGLVSYGCCEPTHPIWEACLSKVKNLRKVSISPWCDEQYMGERLAGSGITYLRKPPATLLGVGAILDEDAVRECAKKTMKAAKNCKVEFIQRDVYELHGGAEKVKRYVELFRQQF